jgi:hypothetical protein
VAGNKKNVVDGGGHPTLERRGYGRNERRTDRRNENEGSMDGREDGRKDGRNEAYQGRKERSILRKEGTKHIKEERKKE